MKNFLYWLFLVVLYLSLSEQTVQTVFDEHLDNDNYFTYTIEMETLNTNNFDSYFSNIDVIALIPYINPIYEDKMNPIYFYKSIDDFKDNYLKALKNKGYHIEANKYIISPIKIKNVIVYSSMNNIYDSINSKEQKYVITKSDTYVKITN